MNAFIITLLTFFYFSSQSVHDETLSYQDQINLAKRFLPSNTVMISPEQPPFTPPVLTYDFNLDEQNELIATFKTKSKDPTQYGAFVIMKSKNGWEKVWETRSRAVGLSFSTIADITGDGVKEYLIGRTIGASAGDILDVFKWNDESLTSIAQLPYHKLEVLKIDNKTGIAVWKRYLADTYFVDVLSWNGSSFVLDKHLYKTYYPTIEKFFMNKLSKMDAWFYWYCLADAQIKAEQFNEAKQSIQKGKQLAKQITMPNDIIQNFKMLEIKLNEEEFHE